jgi:hypothetical protein
MKIEKLTCSNKDYQIISYTVIMAVNKKIVEIKSPDDIWTSNIKKEIDQLNPGDIVWIEGITSKGSDGKMKQLRNLSFKIR